MEGGRKRRRQEQAVKMRRVCQEAVSWGEWKGEREEEGAGRLERGGRCRKRRH